MQIKYFTLRCCLAAVPAALAPAGCYESGSRSMDAADDITTDETADAAGDTDGSEGIECTFGADFVSQFDEACSGAADCVIVYLSLDCCGTTLAAGVNRSEETRFNEAWNECLGELPMCGCPAGPPVAEDGSSTTSPEDILVECNEGTCMTHVP